MLYIIDEKGKGHGALAEFGVTHGVNGEKSISGTIYTNEEVIHGIDRGWKLRFEGETYAFIYAKPVDLGEVVQVEFDAVHSFFYDFSKNAVNEQLKDGSHTMQAYLDFIFKGSGYTFSLDTQVNAFEKQNFGYKNRLALFNDVISSAGVEFSVNGSVVRIIDRVGNDLSTVVRKGFNLKDLTIEKNIGDFVTAQKGFGAWNDEEDHSKGRLEVEYISPLEGIYGRLDADPIVDERYTNANSLRARLENNVEGSYSISVALDMADLTKAGYEYKQPQEGDYIMAINEDLGFKRKIRIVSYTSKYDTSGELIDHNITANSLGMVQEAISGQAKVQNSINELRDEIAQTRREVTEVRVSADGKTNNYWSNEAPNPQEYKLNIGDTWYDTSGEDVVSYGWNGVEWRRVSFDKTAFERQFAEIEKKTQDMTASIAEADNKANDALDKVSLNAELIEEHKNNLESLTGETIPAISKDIQDMREDLGEASKTAKSSLELIGIDRGSFYSKNRRLGAKQTIQQGDTVEILHNGDGFEVGQTYTLSFSAECIQEILTSDVVFEFDTLKSDIVFEFSEAKADIEFIIQNALDTLNIVHLGDSIIMGYGRDVTVPMVESDKLDADVINGGFGGTMANLHPNAEFAKISFVNLADSIATGDFSLQENMKLPELSTAQNKAYMDTVDRIKATDFNSTDALIISYGVNDWTDGTPIDNPSNPKDKETYLGALRYGIDRIKAKYPHLQIMLTQPIFWSDPNTGLTSENRRNSKGNLLPEFAQALDTLGAELGIPVAQTHYGTGINAQNKEAYFYAYDGTHPNDAGNVLLGETIANEFIRLVDFNDLQTLPSRQVSEVTFDFGENYSNVEFEFK